MNDTAAPGAGPPGFREYLAILNRRRAVVALVVLIVFGIGVFYSTRQTNVYKASGEVLLRLDASQAGAVATEARILESAAVHDLALSRYPNAGGVETTADPTVNVISVAAESEDPEAASRTVNAHMNAYVDYSRQAELDRYLTALRVIQPAIDDLQRQIDALGPAVTLTQENADRRSSLLSQQLALRGKLQELQLDSTLAGDNAIVVADAVTPGSPIRPKPTRDAMIALGAGILLAIAAAFVVELLDESIRNADDLQRTIGGLPIFATIPPMRVPRAGPVALVAPRSPPAEGYRALRTSVQFVGVEHGTCIEITSARASEGKSVTTVNLAVVLAQAGQQVIVVDADLRFPTVHRQLGLANDVGLTSVVRGEPLTSALQRVPDIENLSVLTAGPLPHNPSELIASDRFRELMREVRKEAAVVLVDTPPVLAVTDPVAVAALVDAVIIVARAGLSTRREVRRSLRTMKQLGAPVVGAVLNSAAEEPTSYYVTRARVSDTVRGWFQRPEPRSPRPESRVPDAGSSEASGPWADPRGLEAGGSEAWSRQTHDPEPHSTEPGSPEPRSAPPRGPEASSPRPPQRNPRVPAKVRGRPPRVNPRRPS